MEYDSDQSESVQCNEGAEYEVELGSDMELEDDEDEGLSNECNEFRQFVDDANKSLYPGCDRHTKLNVLVRLYNLKAKHGMSYSAYSNWLIAFAEFLPVGNEIPASVYNTKKTLSALGMDYTKIYACPNDCILYRKEYVDETKCPRCGLSRWKIGKNFKERDGVPAKVLWYFPPIPRFKKMFQSSETCKSLTWHATDRKHDGLMRHLADVASWKLVDEKWSDFGSDPRNLRLALSSDGFNPHSSLSSKYSSWPVILVTYNLPPCLIMKRKHMMLILLISGPKQPGNDIDVYLEPLIDDLKLLWEGVRGVYDARQNEYFTLRGLLFWTINDFPAYGNLSGSIVKRYNACPICLEKTKPTRLVNGGKMAYIGHRRFLGRNHPYRKQNAAFNNFLEHSPPPVPLTCEEVLCRVEEEVEKWPFGKKYPHPPYKGAEDETRPCWKKKSIFFELAYWKFLSVPEDYSSNISNLVSMDDLRLSGLKSHDCHALMQQLLSIAIRDVLEKPVCKGYVRNRNRPEGCIAGCYIAEEAVEFIAESFFNDTTVGIPTAPNREDKPTSGATVVSVYGKLFDQAHLCVLQNTDEIRSYFSEHMEYLKNKFPRFKNNKKWPTDKQNKTFADWLKVRVNVFIAGQLSEPSCDIPEIVRWLADKPSNEVPKFSGYKIRGVQYNTKARDDLRSTQNSGVYLLAETSQVASARGKGLVTDDMSFYGVINEILELDYEKFRIPIFKCDWVENGR
ncbi:uncharacterized protein LOC112165478 [Rosa chinensis]|uniref:uncharacterized protein LOC112165478 n=1 Tax=Rosa chinensis TaxID=74649 RepID=UPI000D092E22|nr:uncharacterized protein LOC112165478 [Rosa chinensis]